MESNLTWDNITQPIPTGYQVRVVRRGKEYSRLFSFKQWGGKHKALAAANSWRDQIKTAFRATTHRMMKCPSNNKSTGITGITRTVYYDKRRDRRYLSFGVCWTDHKGKVRNKKFQVGPYDNYSIPMESKALAAAKQFRRDWEEHADRNTIEDFDPYRYRNWRQEL